MRSFEYTRAHGLERAMQMSRDGARPIAGGTNLLDLMKLEIETPRELVDINRLPLGGIEPEDDGLRIGALVTNSACAAHERVRRDYPVLARAILAGATFQLRQCCKKPRWAGQVLSRPILPAISASRPRRSASG